MKIKEYNLFKTVKKTAKENNLVIAENNIATAKTLFDFSELDNIDIQEWEKEVIKTDALECVRAYNKESFYGAEYDTFTSCMGMTVYIPHRIYRKDGKHLYNIMQLVKITHTHSERKSVYSDWENTQTEYKSSYTERLDDIEI